MGILGCNDEKIGVCKAMDQADYVVCNDGDLFSSHQWSVKLPIVLKT